MLVGEARSKCEHLANTPLRPDVAQDLWSVSLIRGARATTAIEGNTLTEEQVAGILNGTFKAPESRQYQEQEVRNMLDSLTELGNEAMLGTSEPLSVERINDFNRQVLKGLVLEPGAEAGIIRHDSVVVARYRAPCWEDCEYLLGRLCEWLEGPQFVHEDEDIQFALCLARAVIAHLYLAWIHPYYDGNGRTARLVEFLLLARSGRIPLPAAHLLSNHYNETRDLYYRELDKASQSGGDIKSFLEYAVQGFVEGIRDEIGRIRGELFHATWTNYVHEVMNDQPAGETRDRQRALVLALEPGTLVRRSDLTKLTASVAERYANAGERTLARDLNRLTSLRLISRTSAGYRANTDQLSLFLPPMADPERRAPDRF
jgi:Fic family protein